MLAAAVRARRRLLREDAILHHGNRTGVNFDEHFRAHRCVIRIFACTWCCVSNVLRVIAQARSSFLFLLRHFGGENERRGGVLGERYWPMNAKQM